MSQETLLMVADSEHDANMLYAVRMFVPDPFIYLRMHGRCHIVMSDLEIDRARQQAPHCRIISLTECRKELKKDRRKASFAGIIGLILRQHRLRRVVVPYNFPHGLAEDLRRLEIRVSARQGSYFPQREHKTAEEVKKISGALMMAEVGLAEGIQALKNSNT